MRTALTRDGLIRRAIAVLVVTLTACGDGVSIYEALTSRTTVGEGLGTADGGATTTTDPGNRVPIPTAPPTTAIRAVDLRDGGAPPWAGDKIADDSVAVQTVLEQWEAASNRGTARVVLPADVALRPVALARPASPSGGWGVTWDDPGKPGVRPGGEFCETCGRSVVGVVATAARADKAAVERSPTVIEWSDGSVAGYGPPTGTSRQFLARLVIAGQGSMYQVWSYVSLRHLEYLLSQLRFVEGGP